MGVSLPGRSVPFFRTRRIPTWQEYRLFPCEILRVHPICQSLLKATRHTAFRRAERELLQQTVQHLLPVLFR